MRISPTYKTLAGLLFVALLFSALGSTVYSFTCVGENIRITSFTEVEHTCEATTNKTCHSEEKSCDKDCCSQEMEFKVNDVVNNNIQKLTVDLELVPLPLLDFEKPIRFPEVIELSIRPPPDLAESGRNHVIRLQKFLC